MEPPKLLQHVNILVDDLRKAIIFYTDIVGLKLDETPDLDFPSQFFKLANGAQIHMNERKDDRPNRAHFCLVCKDFNQIFRRARAAKVIEVTAWGKIRRIGTGAMQMFLRDPSGNLVEIASRPGDVIDEDILLDREFVHPPDEKQISVHEQSPMESDLS